MSDTATHGATYPDTPYGRVRAHSDAWHHVVTDGGVIAEGPDSREYSLRLDDLDAMLADSVQLERIRDGWPTCGDHCAEVERERDEYLVELEQLRHEKAARAEQQRSGDGASRTDGDGRE